MVGSRLSSRAGVNSFSAFTQRLGFREYPFAIFSAEGERLRLEELFVAPTIYSPLVETFSNRSSVIISGERGTGKTALLYELTRNTSSSSLNVYLEDFGDLPLDHSQAQLYEFLIANLAEAIFKSLAGKPWVVNGLSKDERLLLSYLLEHCVSDVSKKRIGERIREIQIPVWRRAGLWCYNRTRGLLNYGTNVALSITSDAIQRHFPGLPPLEPSAQRDYFPALKTDEADKTQVAQANFALLQRLSFVLSSGRLECFSSSIRLMKSHVLRTMRSRLRNF